MNKKGKEYELLIQTVYLNLLKKFPNIHIELRKKIKGKSNTLREIDIYFEMPVGPHIYKTAIECKNYQKKIGIDLVEEYLGKLQDLDIEKGIMVTKTGYTTSAIKFANKHGIDLIEIRKPTEKDWAGSVKTINTIMNIFYPEVFNIRLITDDKKLESKKFSGWPDELILYDKNGKFFKDINKLINENIKNDLTEKEKTVEVNFNRPYFLKVDGKMLKTTGISFKYKFHKIPERIIIDAKKLLN